LTLADRRSDDAGGGRTALPIPKMRARAEGAATPSTR